MLQTRAEKLEPVSKKRKVKIPEMKVSLRRQIEDIVRIVRDSNSSEESEDEDGGGGDLPLLGGGGLADRVKEFLPRLKKANETLDPASANVEIVSDEEEEHIEMVSSLPTAIYD